MGRIARFFGAACVATGTIAMSGLVASGAAVYSVAEGFITAGKMVKDALKEEKRGKAAETLRLKAGAPVPQIPAGEVSP